MSDWSKVKQVVSSDGLRRMTVQTASGPLFTYTEERWRTEDGYQWWEPSGWSGLYASAEEAEKAARAELPWLRDQNDKRQAR